MKRLHFLVVISALIILSGCYSGISGKVVDGVTGEPIEGALVLAQWTKTHGLPGLRYHDLFKIAETLTDKGGLFSLSGTSDPSVEPPQMIIYKEGYIPWRNDAIFPSSDIVKDNEWKDNVTYKLDILTNKFTYVQLYDFLDYSIIGLGLKESSIFSDLMHKISVKRFEEIESKKSKAIKP